MAVMKILVVDASPETRSDVVRSLSELDGIVVQGAVAGVRDAIRAVEACPLDGVVAGVAFPDDDVVQLLGAARRKRLGTVVVFGSDERRDELLAAGASHVVPDRGQLAATLVGLAAVPAADPYALVGRLAVGVAHDINNYLAAGEVALTFLERAAASDASRNDLRQLRASFDGIGRLARSLTGYARGGDPVAAPIDLEALIRRVLESFGRQIPEGVRVVVEAGGEVPLVRGVASELEQVVLNLLLNGCEALSWGGTLYIVVERGAGGHVRLEVADTGRGLPPEVVAGDLAMPSSKHRGRGLGLAIVREVVARHGGQLALGRAPGGGARVEILLPV